MPNIGPLELIVVLVIVLVIFGPKRLPSLGRQLGSGMREFKDSITGKDGDRDRDEERDATGRPVLDQNHADEPVATHAAPSAPSEPAGSDAGPDQRA
jgi:sec-independent protein translocase protein TatA